MIWATFNRVLINQNPPTLPGVLDTCNAAVQLSMFVAKSVQRIVIGPKKTFKFKHIRQAKLHEMKLIIAPRGSTEERRLQKKKKCDN